MTWQDDLRALSGTISTDELPDLIGELERAKSVALTRLVQPSTGGNGNRRSNDLLTVDQVAKRLNVSGKWVYDHQHDIGRRKVGGHIRFDERAVERFIKGCRDE